MSKLAKHLAARDTGRRHLDQPPIPSLNVIEEINDAVITCAREYRIEARLGSTAVVPDARYKAGESVWDDAIRTARRKIIEEVFGEFRPLIYKAHEAIHRRDWQEASLVLGKLHDQMFVEGV